MPRPTAKKPPPPLDVPPGVRLALLLPDGTELSVFLKNGRPCTVLGECPRLPKAPPRRKTNDEPAGLFDAAEAAVPDHKPAAAAVVRVYAAQADLDKAYAVASHSTMREYPTEVRVDPLA